MAKTNKKIALHQLDAELGNVGLNCVENDGESTITYADGSDDDKALTDAIATHVAQPDPEPTVADKLASVGLNLDDLKAALGL